MSGYLTTHVLDTALGCPAEALQIDLYRIDGSSRQKLRSVQTNADGRTDEPVLPTEEFTQGTYEPVFRAGDYLRASGGGSSFLDIIPAWFSMQSDDHFHVPLLLSPFSYATYRRS